jgi:hypothetical protein
MESFLGVAIRGYVMVDDIVRCRLDELARHLATTHIPNEDFEEHWPRAWVPNEPGPLPSDSQ